METVIRTEDRGRVRIITFDRPDALNAFNDELYRAAAEALGAAARDDNVAAAVVTGAGRAFSAGQDLKEMASLGRSIVDATVDSGAPKSSFPAFVTSLSTFPKPLLAAVNGVAVGIGLTMLAHCDIVFVAESARMRTPFSQLGVAPEAASSYLFPIRMGWQRAAWVLFSSEWLSAEQAVDYGIALQVCRDATLLEETIGAAETIAAHSLASLVATKRLLLDAQTEGVLRARRLEDSAFSVLLGQPENAAALRSFVDRT